MMLRSRSRAQNRSTPAILLAQGLCTALLGVAACGDDPQSPTDTTGTDTSDSTSPSDTNDTSDTSSPSDTDDIASGDTGAGDTGSDTSPGDTVSGDTGSGDTTTPMAAQPGLIAWTGASPNSPAFGGISSFKVSGSAFLPQVSLVAGSQQNPVRSGDAGNLGADIDGDGLMDLVAWSGFSNNSPFRGAISVYLATGEGYGEPTTWFTGTDQAAALRGTTANLAGDIDGDGRADLVAWSGLADNSPFRGGVAVHLSTGTAFAPPSTWLTGTDQAPVMRGSTANLLGDVDGDGKDDLVAWSGLAINSPFRGAVNVHLSTGTAFAAASSWLTGTDQAPVMRGNNANLLADVDGDGRADLIAVSSVDPMGPSRGGISVHLSTGTSFAAASTWRTGTMESPVPPGDTAILATDLDGDEKADLVFWNRAFPPNSWGGLTVMRSNGAGFDAPAAWFAGRPEAAVGWGETANLGGAVFSAQ